jgi:hypothetical protein
MSNEISTNSISNIEQVLVGGDLAKLSAHDRVIYYKKVCETLCLNPLTKPFDYITLNGKLTLYASKGCAEQLRATHKISLSITSRETIEGVYVVTVQARGADGREDGATGAVTIQGLKGEALANAFMKAETKAKRRATLSICGLNMLDETEVETIRHPTPSGGTTTGIRPLQPGPEDGFEVDDGIWRFPGGKHAKKKLSELTGREHSEYIVKTEAYFEKLKKPMPFWWDSYLSVADGIIREYDNPVFPGAEEDFYAKPGAGG